MTSTSSIARVADALGGRPAGGRSRRCPAVAGAAVAGAGELHRRAGAAAVAPRQSLPALYQYSEKADEPPAGLPSRVFICGISALPPVYLQACRRWVSMSMSMSCLPTPAATTGEILGSGVSGEAAVASAAPSPRARALPLFRDTEQAPGLFNDAGNRMSATRCSPPGETGARLYLPAGRVGAL